MRTTVGALWRGMRLVLERAEGLGVSGQGRGHKNTPFIAGVRRFRFADRDSRAASKN